MAVVAFNCNKIKHTYWPFTFKDTEDETGKIPGKKIMVRMPSKGTFEKIQDFQEIAEMDESEIRAAGVIDSLHALIAEILNNNLENPNPKKPKKPVRADDLEIRIRDKETVHTGKVWLGIYNRYLSSDGGYEMLLHSKIFGK